MKFVDLRTAEDIAANPALYAGWATEDPSVIEQPAAAVNPLATTAPRDASGLTSAAYSLGKARLSQDTDIARAAASYAESLRKRQNAASRQQADWSWGRARDNAAWGAASRGFGAGGAHDKDAWATYGQGRKSAYDSMAMNEQNDAYSSQQAQENITRSYVRGNEDLELGEFDRKANLAASLRGIA